MNKKKKVWRIITGILAVLGALFIAFIAVMLHEEQKKNSWNYRLHDRI